MPKPKRNEKGRKDRYDSSEPMQSSDLKRESNNPAYSLAEAEVGKPNACAKYLIWTQQSVSAIFHNTNIEFGSGDCRRIDGS